MVWREKRKGGEGKRGEWGGMQWGVWEVVGGGGVTEERKLLHRVEKNPVCGPGPFKLSFRP